MKSNRVTWMIITVVLVVPVIAFGIMNVLEKKYGQLPVLGSIKSNEAGQQTEFVLTDHENKTVTAAGWDDRIVVVNFFFTHCPVICPVMTRNLSKVKQSSDVMIQSFSIDPERDSVAQLQAYRKKFGITSPQWQMITGNKKVIYHLARNGFKVVATDGDGGPTDFIHSEKLVLIDRQGMIRGYYTGTDDKEVKQLIDDIQKLQHEKE